MEHEVGTNVYTIEVSSSEPVYYPYQECSRTFYFWVMVSNEIQPATDRAPDLDQNAPNVPTYYTLNAGASQNWDDPVTYPQTIPEFPAIAVPALAALAAIILLRRT